ncbi:MAG: 4Fe-4S binding protein [Chloroflexota bacterium]|nr:4Fe-4S binding protein [Chloroflexota bacterium]
MIYVDDERCTGCGTCVDVCPVGAIQLVDGVARIDQEECVECEICLSACPETAILSVSDGVLVEQETITPAKTSSQALAEKTSRAIKVAPWLGAALAFVGREVLPRLATHFLNSLGPVDNQSITGGGGGISTKSSNRRRRLRRRQGRH